MATLSVQKVSPSGTTVTYSAAAGGGDDFVNDGFTRLHVKNGGGGSVTVTIDSPTTCDFGLAAHSAHDLQVAVPAGEDRWIGPFNKARFNNTSTNKVAVSYSGVTSVTVAAVN